MNTRRSKKCEHLLTHLNIPFIVHLTIRIWQKSHLTHHTQDVLNDNVEFETEVEIFIKYFGNNFVTSLA